MDDTPALYDAIRSAPQDWIALKQYLSGQGMTLALDSPPRQFSGGLANLNYLLELDGREVVLRRPPAGELPAGSFDMGREFRILSQLWRGLPLAPQGIHLCDDRSVLGAPFQIIEFRRGFSIRDQLPEHLQQRPGIGEELAARMIEVLVQIHEVDPASVGLDGLGRHEGFLQRAVAGWTQRAVDATDGYADTALKALIAETASWLRRHQQPDQMPVLLHNDLKLDNILLDRQTLIPNAVLDWDQCTRGSALFDLATTLSYWAEPGDPEAFKALRQTPSAAPGFPSRQQLAERYARARGIDLSDFRFFRVLALFKLAVIFYQLHRRYREGNTQDARYAGFGAVADAVMDFSQSVARGQVF